MPICKTCGADIEVPEGWTAGSAARRHYWAEHPDRMLRPQADRAATTQPAPAEPAPPPARRRPRTG
jgi:hypothetical protein